jgi:hypothetical protein
MAFCPGGLIFTGPFGGDVFLDLETLKQTYLSAGKSGSSPWPAWYDGTVLKSPPYLYRPEKKLATGGPGAWIYILQMTPNGLLALDTQGEGYLIQKKEQAP